MPTFIYLVNWTDQGIRGVKDTVGRAQAAKERAERMGGNLTYHWTLGQQTWSQSRSCQMKSLESLSRWPLAPKVASVRPPCGRTERTR